MSDEPEAARKRENVKTRRRDKAFSPSRFHVFPLSRFHSCLAQSSPLIAHCSTSLESKNKRTGEQVPPVNEHKQEHLERQRDRHRR